MSGQNTYARTRRDPSIKEIDGVSQAAVSLDVSESRVVVVTSNGSDGTGRRLSELARQFLKSAADEHDRLMAYRIIYNAGRMEDVAEVVDMASLLTRAGLNIEALKILESRAAGRRLDSNGSGHDVADQFQLAVQAARQVVQNLPRLESMSAASISGDLALQVGENQYAYRLYWDAIASITAALDKGHLSRLDDAYVYLGLAQQAVFNYPEARKAFSALSDVPYANPRLTELWQIYARIYL
jgi:tetratricopeptide (TPR) repeat protein